MIMMKLFKGILCIIGLFLFLAPNPRTAPSPEPVKAAEPNALVESNEFAKGFVEDRLVSPSTADFPSIWQLKYEQVGARTWKL